MEDKLKPIPLYSTEHIAKRGFFYAGGGYQTNEKGEHYFAGQMFVEVYHPKAVTKPYPLIFFHGKGQTNVNWLGTPDGREGWLDFFLKRGYIVYLAEQPARGRSAWYPSDGGTTYQTIETVEYRFTTDKGGWPQAKLHTRWPKSANERGTNDYDQFMASQVQFLDNDRKTVGLVTEAAGDLLEYTGPAVILTHSQAGRFAWPIADRYHEKVMGIIAIEPNGPPFSSNPDTAEANNYGITDEPLTFDPPVSSPAEFKLRRVEPDRPGRKPGVLQALPARRLPRLAAKPILVMCSEASYHVEYDYLTSQFLTEAGVQHDYIELADVGIHGNGHMVMLEDNSEQIAGLIADWLEKRHL